MSNSKPLSQRNTTSNNEFWEGLNPNSKKKQQFNPDDRHDSYVHVLTAMLNLDREHPEICDHTYLGYRKLIEQAIGNFGSTRYWYRSAGVRNAVLNNQNPETVGDHMISIKIQSIVLLDLVRKNDGTVSAQEVSLALKSMQGTCLLTKVEDASIPRWEMPAGWDGKDIFARYKVAKGGSLSIYETTGNIRTATRVL